MLVCDKCNYRVCHIYCMNPPLKAIPEESFYCKICQFVSHFFWFIFETHGLKNNFTKQSNSTKRPRSKPKKYDRAKKLTIKSAQPEKRSKNVENFSQKIIPENQKPNDHHPPILCRINGQKKDRQQPDSVLDTDWMLDGQNRTNRRRKISQTALKSLKYSKKSYNDIISGKPNDSKETQPPEPSNNLPFTQKQPKIRGIFIDFLPPREVKECREVCYQGKDQDPKSPFE